MARPRLGESESKRLQMVITEDELNAIEDWQFKNRVPSKSEAIRRLVQIGLRVEREIPQLIHHTFGMTNHVEKVLTNIKSKVAEAKNAAGSSDEPDLDMLVTIIRTAIKDTDSALVHQLESADHLFELISEVSPMVNREKFRNLSKAMDAANRVRERTIAGETVLEKIRAERDRKDDDK